MADMFATPTDLAALLQKDVDTASATLALEVATSVVQAAAGGQRILLATDTEELVYGGVGSLLRLTQQPVVSVTSVTYDGSALTEGTASGTWRLTRGGIWRDLGWAEVYGEPSQVTVVYTHGYADGHQALQLARGAALSIARSLFENPTGVVREQIDDYAVAYADAAARMEAAPALKALIRKQYGPRARMVSVI